MDAGFSCPNRDAGTPCAFCASDGSRAPYLGDRKTLEEQIRGSVGFLRQRYDARRFLLYFQAFSGTYAAPDRLREIYDRGLACAEFVGLVVSTRPDCVDEPRADLLAGYASRDLDVWVELGLQSAQDRTLRSIDRGHEYASFERAFQLLRERGISVAVHLIAGLPGEGAEQFLSSVRRVARLAPDGVKFHNLVLVEGTELWRRFSAGAVAPFGLERYVHYVASAITLLPASTVILRLGFDPPPGLRSIPSRRTTERFGGKRLLYDAVEAQLRARATRQGEHWTDGSE